jgi:hypothetical protein
MRPDGNSSVVTERLRSEHFFDLLELEEVQQVRFAI